ncbi:MAG: hypothetical protein KQJ78_19535 [Deltaproteobacteria bacterium]|nr:hypothetical protein [Deltaproteobacteria bacterium]
MTIVLETPEVPPSLNQLLRLHIGAKARLKRALWASCLHSLLAHQHGTGLPPGLPPKAREPRGVSITVRRRRILDHDNLVGGCKPLVDVLVTLGLLFDDSPAWLVGGKVKYEQHLARRGEPTGTAIQIEW